MIVTPVRRARLLYEEARNEHLHAGLNSINASKAAKITVLSMCHETKKVWEKNAYPHHNYHKVIEYWNEVEAEINKIP